ncbi:MAG TPA: hypothetical protein VJM10_06495 [Candidatus Methylomirabilis sp.]|nr:hypothetical protein [Candidatus Methylomirabilis sp.]
MKTVHFISGTFHPGLNITVRRGLAWSQKGLLPGETITLCVCPHGHDHDVVAQARVAFVMVAQVADIPDELMAYEHEPLCRTKEGLLAAMSRVLGEVRSDDIVTVIGFEMDLSRPSQ